MVDTLLNGSLPPDTSMSVCSCPMIKAAGSISMQNGHCGVGHVEKLAPVYCLAMGELVPIWVYLYDSVPVYVKLRYQKLNDVV